MKQAYTQYDSALARLSKRGGISINEIALGLDTNHFIIDGCLQILSPLDKSFLRAEYDILSGKGHHIYLNDKCFCDWLVAQAVSVKKEHLEFMDEQVANNMPIVFHFPTHSRLTSFLFIKMRNYMTLEEANVIKADYSCVSMHNFPDDDYNINLALSLGLYLKCFPECIIPGVPQDLKHPSHHSNIHMYSINISPNVRSHNGTHASPCGHFRRGHFRVLNSEWYKKKRHQVVFIDETFVNGKAHTVLSPEEMDSSSSSSTSIA